MCRNDNYPRNITDAYTLLAGWQQEPSRIWRGSDGLVFTNIGEEGQHDNGMVDGTVLATAKR
jgi:hypothetical protein